jgi:hypothetical protein
MMALSALRPDASLAEFLAYRARSASLRRLAADLIVGLGGVSAALWWRPASWLLLSSAAICFAAFGAWGLADRARARVETSSRRVRRELLVWMCAVIVAVGALAASALLYSVWALALGTWIS